ncbi:NACHT, LRR and PYD domains-containing protein 12-like [Melopsittacus undulatus]|uniref:NACHT, LRR and PYD domains-containing protein 12-like n=1 Tax=Melopsittacus undulatus TaxID=13146 RepID=UPI00146D9F5F|nr:NACHT, LRR and PYD domains-containing protein 12-like [Melopsittacus undulatus]
MAHTGIPEYPPGILLPPHSIPGHSPVNQTPGVDGSTGTVPKGVPWVGITPVLRAGDHGGVVLGVPRLSLRLFPCSLRYSRLTSACCQDLAAVLSTSPSLEELDLSFSDGLRDAGVELLCQGLQPRSCRLRTLRLGSCRLTGACRRALAMGTPPLTCLDLSDNELGADGVLELCRWLRSPSCPLRTLG